MFKKELKFSAQNNLSGKDKKILRSNLISIFKEELVDEILNGFEKLTLNKIKGQKSSVIKDDQNQCLLVDSSGKGDMFPTIQLVDLVPGLLKKVELKEGVEKFIFNGANLMWPGVNMVENQEYKQDEVVKVVKSNSDQIIAIGSMANNYSENNQEGIAVYILTYLNDKLYELQSKPIVPSKPINIKQSLNNQSEALNNQSEALNNNQDNNQENQVVQELEKDNKQQKQEAEEEDNNNDDDEDYNDEDNLQSLTKMVNSKNKPINKKEDNKGKKDEEEVEIKKDKIKKCKEKKEESSDDDDDNNDEMTKITDNYIFEAFMNCLKMVVCDKELPMDPSVLWNHMLGCKNQKISLDIKNSSYKKIGKFLQQMNKLNIIEYKIAKKGGQPMISKVNRTSKHYLDWTLSIQEVVKTEQSQVKAAKADTFEQKLISQIQVQELFKVKKEYQTVIQSQNPYVSTQQAIIGLTAYINQNNLLDKKQVTLDPLLAQLFGTTDNNQTINKELLFKRIEEALSPYHKITYLTNNTEAIKPGKFQGVHLIAEKSHNKFITKIQGLSQFIIDVALMSNYLQIKFACSSTINDCVQNKHSGKEIVIQGSFINELTELFVKSSKIDPKYISTLNKLDKKKK